MVLAPARGFLDWPFFEASHRQLALRLQDWAATQLAGSAHPEARAAVDLRCRELVGMLGARLGVRRSRQLRGGPILET